MKKHTLVLPFCVAGALCAQTSDKTIAFQYFANEARTVPATPVSVFHYGVAGMAGKTVAGKPFSGSEETHTLQVLADGTRIERTDRNKYFRDAEGRTRIEQAGGTVMITDPVSGVTAEMNLPDKTARKMMVRMMINGSPGTPDPATLAKLKAEMDSGKAGPGRIVAVARTETRTLAGGEDAAGERVKVSHILLKADSTNDAQVKARAEAILQQLRNGADFAKLAADVSEDSASKANNGELGWIVRGATVPEFEKAAFSLLVGQISGAVKTSYGYHILRVEGHQGNGPAEEDLGTQLLNGVRAQGTRSTIEIPVGQIGNDREIKVVSERWYSDELQIMVKSTNSDPRFGDTTYEMTGIVQGTQDPGLFQIPSDFTVK